MEKLDVIKTFLFKSIPDMIGYECNMDFIKFVFNKDDLSKLERIVLFDNKYDKKIGLNVIRWLRDNSINQTDDAIRINNYDEFFDNMKLIFDEYEKKGKLGNNFIRSIWLRMGVNDLNNVEDFLSKQLDFIKHDIFIPYRNNKLLDNGEISIEYSSRCNGEFFETNNHIRFKVFDDGSGDYTLPVVHYALSCCEDSPICYIYGIQNVSSHDDNDHLIGEYLKNVKKKLRNKYVSKDFVLSLGMFLDLLYKNGIDEVRVPIYQVFNYTYHEKLSDILNYSYNSYSDDEKKKLEELYEKGNIDDKILDYIYDKTMYDRFTGKADIISKNKTERLINTFIVLNSVFDNIEICNEPFIQGDELIIKIKKATNILDILSEKNKEYSK